jgi:hypothetical protein
MKTFAVKEIVNGIDFYRINNDFCGNPRYVVHFLQINYDYERAHKIALKCGGAKYRAKWFGGGFVFQSYDLHELSVKIKETASN